MNQRFRELTDKIWAEEYWNHPNTDKLLPAQLNKFAESIVRECDLVISEDDGATHHSELLFTYFGLES